MTPVETAGYLFEDRALYIETTFLTQMAIFKHKNRSNKFHPLQTRTQITFFAYISNFSISKPDPTNFPSQHLTAGEISKQSSSSQITKSKGTKFHPMIDPHL